MRFHSLIVSAFVMFVSGGLLTLFFPIGEAAAGSGQSHPGIEVCDTNLCVTAGKVGIGTTTPQNVLSVFDPVGGRFTVESLDPVGTIALHLRNQNTAADWFFITNGSKLIIGNDIKRSAINITQTSTGAELQVGGNLKVDGKFTSDQCSFPTFVGYTSTAYKGNQNNYSVADSKCAAQYPGSHVCSATEVIRSQACKKTWDNNGGVWYSTGMRTVTDAIWDPYNGQWSFVITNDCNAWSSTTSYGSIWDTTGSYSIMSYADCNSARPFACCA